MGRKRGGEKGNKRRGREREERGKTERQEENKCESIIVPGNQVRIVPYGNCTVYRTNIHNCSNCYFHIYCLL